MIDNSLLLERVKNGDKEAEEELVENNMRLVHSIAGRFISSGYESDDLSQVGAIGLIKAIHKFDMSYGVKFSTYAVPVIMGEIKRFLRDDGMIKVSRSLKENAFRGRKAAQNLKIKLGREPTVEEVAKETGIKSEELIEAFDAISPIEAISYVSSDGKETELPIASEKDGEEEIINKILVEDMLKSLDKREKQIITLRYFKGKTQAEIAKIVGVSQVQISRIEKASIEKLKKLYT